MECFVARLNIARFNHMLAEATHPAEKRTLESLLKEEQYRLKEAETRRYEKSRCLLAA
jgi:hypothetical protein